MTDSPRKSISQWLELYSSKVSTAKISEATKAADKSGTVPAEEDVANVVAVFAVRVRDKQENMQSHSSKNFLQTGAGPMTMLRTDMTYSKHQQAI